MIRIWEKARTVQLQVADGILPEFDIGFDKQIPQAVQDELRAFVKWVEGNYPIPVTLWVDFEYRHYLVSRDGRRAGFLFYWADFADYPVFDDPEDIPILRLPVRTERSTMEEILASFIQGISHYFAWICNENREDVIPDDQEVEEILQSYLRLRQQ